MSEIVSFRTDTGLKPLSPLIDGPVPQSMIFFPQSDHQPGAVSAHSCRACASAKHSLKDSPKFCTRPDLGRAIRWPAVERNQIMCCLAQILDGGMCTTGRCAN